MSISGNKKQRPRPTREELEAKNRGRHADWTAFSARQDAMARDIIEATGKPLRDGRTAQELAQDLNELAAAVKVHAGLRANPISSAQKIQLEKIRSAARKLAKYTGTLCGQDMREKEPRMFELLTDQAQLHAQQYGPYSGLPNTPTKSGCIDYQPAPAVLQAVSGAWLLQCWSNDLLENHKNEACDLSPVERWLVGGQLPRLYEKFFDRFGVSKGSSAIATKTSSIKFVTACLEALGYKPKEPNAIVLHWDRYRRSQA